MLITCLALTRRGCSAPQSLHMTAGSSPCQQGTCSRRQWLIAGALVGVILAHSQSQAASAGSLIAEYEESKLPKGAVHTLLAEADTGLEHMLEGHHDRSLITARHLSGYLELSSKLAEALREAIEMDMSDAKEIEVPPLPLHLHVTCRNEGRTCRPGNIMFTLTQFHDHHCSKALYGALSGQPQCPCLGERCGRYRVGSVIVGSGAPQGRHSQGTGQGLAERLER